MIYYILLSIFLILFVYAWFIRNKLLSYSRKHNVYQIHKLHIYFIGVDWCESCQSFIPIWIRLKKHYEKDSKILFHQISISKSSKYNKITGYPTILIKYRGAKYFFKDKRDFMDMIQFIDNIKFDKSNY